MSDTLYEYLDGSGQGWRLNADDIVVETPVTVRNMTWWGAYSDDYFPAEETMRLRLYGARSGDGLPGNILWEESASTVMRSATGRNLAPWPPGGAGAIAEYEFELNLATPFALAADVPYWLEIVQVGDVSSMFVWDSAQAEETGTAYLRSGQSDWRYYYGVVDFAFQLSTVPEPATMALLLGSCCVLGRTRAIRTVSVAPDGFNSTLPPTEV